MGEDFEGQNPSTPEGDNGLPEKTDTGGDAQEEAPQFQLEEESEATVDTDRQPEPTPMQHKLTHNGQVYEFNDAKYTELAQKGFDYDSKIGPHAQLAEMVDSDPALQQVISDYWYGSQHAPEEAFNIDDLDLKKVEDFDTEGEWLKDSLKKMQQAMPAPPPPPPPQLPPQPVIIPEGKAEATKRMLMGRDPANYNKVIAALPQFVNSLSVKDYQRIDQDPAALCQFYDFVKSKVSYQGNSTPPFKIKSGGGGNPNDGKPKKGLPWKLSSVDFRKEFAKRLG